MKRKITFEAKVHPPKRKKQPPFSTLKQRAEKWAECHGEIMRGSQYCVTRPMLKSIEKRAWLAGYRNGFKRGKKEGQESIWLALKARHKGCSDSRQRYSSQPPEKEEIIPHASPVLVERPEKKSWEELYGKDVSSASTASDSKRGLKRRR